MMSEIGQASIDGSQIFDVLSTPPVLASHTVRWKYFLGFVDFSNELVDQVYTAIMNAQSGSFHTTVRNYDD